ncbi:D-ribose pyranase [Trichinella spiralis]|uniref:D-ribose pyranase n=1 Tax=Trichinella spiralis TaxID=6334 RepID=A0ABR3KW79_TRISP
MTEGTPEQAEVTSTLWSKMTRRQLTRSIPINYVQTADASFLAANLPSACCRCIIGVLSNLQYPPPIVCRRTTVRRGRAVVRRAEQRPTLLNDRAAWNNSLSTNNCEQLSSSGENRITVVQGHVAYLQPILPNNHCTSSIERERSK